PFRRRRAALHQRDEPQPRPRRRLPHQQPRRRLVARRRLPRVHHCQQRQQGPVHQHRGRRARRLARVHGARGCGVHEAHSRHGGGP
ncbi:hypothetical protein BN1723_020917, partial [Verticillium longisporum]